MHNRLPCLLHDFLFLTLPTDPFQMLEIASIDRCDVFATEYTNLKFLGCRIAWGKGSAGTLKIF
jgi:hypothetical protein